MTRPREHEPLQRNAPHPLPSGVPIFDDQIYHELFDPGDPAGADCVAMFLADADGRIRGLRTATAGKMDLCEIASAAHSIAGSSVALGAAQLGEAARALQHAAQAADAPPDADDFRALVGIIETSLKTTRVAMAAFLQRADADRAA